MSTPTVMDWSLRPAREDFHIGQRVSLTDKARSWGIHVQAPWVMGTVRGFGRRSHILRVQRDGIKTVAAYHRDFWEPAVGDHTPRNPLLDDIAWHAEQVEMGVPDAQYHGRAIIDLVDKLRGEN